ncbi:predicted Zn-dependent protease with MMP-like domain [Jatrophihabitans sp. GAS493]|uniref:metallopeptidase family protein n=1 Tax=Jatrophihabitans sp. GAS493 TaxID=1907575 RepID=UPI000BB8271D|nr:metallopeptidase family protein [Jatrophihabitans sp. GAS493]SOD71092.1 predicted Zn-dependent protease with MMP-like domain [Jatrophihabitans sp. GAS493]
MITMSRARFAALVEDALDAIPAEFASRLGNVVIQIEEENPDEPETLGLYVGVALTERLSDYSFATPDTITIYRRPILQLCATEEEVADEVAITVVHEIGHFFGIDDDRLHDLGWA